MGTADGAFNVLVRVGGEAEPPFSLAGAFNVLLNSLAVSFCLDVDDQLSSSTSVLPRSLLRRFDVSGNGKRPLVDDEALWAPIARALLTPPPSRETRIKSELIKHDMLEGAIGLKITGDQELTKARGAVPRPISLEV